ncbi:MAG: CRISPR system precrRNA processing endoribonuclease RAMP protein Cas6 [Candidatus Lokiarchaeota archaeon]|nr:CRISPR system precrRNA processing endoribonuclease RAMP protein Cas6 [Candidatus Lokiarchaeota archaeon]
MAAKMLHAITLDLERDQEMPGVPELAEISGATWRAAILKFLSEKAPVLHDELHENTKRRDYSVGIRADEHEPHLFHGNIRFFTDSGAESFLRAILDAKAYTFVFHGIPYKIKDLSYVHSSLAEIRGNARHVQRFKIEFESPAFFRKERRYSRLEPPSTDLVFENTIATWNALVRDGDTKIDLDAFMDYAWESVKINRARLKTDLGQVNRDTDLAGYVGYIEWSCKETENPSNPWIDAMLRLAEWTGVGGSRSSGMGRVKYTRFG